MACVFNQRLSAYYDGEMDGASRAEMERHVAGCAQCAGELGEMAAVSGLFAGRERAGLSQISMYRLHDRTEMVMRADVMRMARALAAIAACVLVGASLWLLKAPAPSAAYAQEPVELAPPWVDVAVTTSAETSSLDTTTPAAAWYLADVSSRGDDVQ